MTDFVALPLLVTLTFAVAGSRVLDRLRPAAAARASAVLLAAVVVAAVPTLWLVGMSGLAHVGLHNPVVDWSAHLLPSYQPIGALVGGAALILAVRGTVRGVRVLVHHRKLRCIDTEPFGIVDDDEVFAYTLPGPAATIAISRGLRDALDDREFDLVVAHELSHARHRHDRYKLLALIASAFVPAVRSISNRLDFYIERWADEDALDRTGVDRRIAAVTIAKVALAGSGPAPALGIASHGVAARASALLAPESQVGALTRLRIHFVVTGTLLLAAWQLHHSVMFAGHLLA